MSRGQFRVEELNPFMEWHLHTTAESSEGASKAARTIAKKIGRRTRVSSVEGTVFDLFDP